MTETEADASGSSKVLIQAKDFTDAGGWTFDSQFVHEMGAPYLLGHGLGSPVADARTTVDIPQTGRYHVWVRTKDWVPSHHPGRFSVTIGAHTLTTTFGASGQDWAWEAGPAVNLARGATAITLHDLTGFDARCEAICLSLDDVPPPAEKAALMAWRKKLLRLPDTPVDGGKFDVLVVGGGVTGSAAALAAARLDLRVALIHD
ncbi:hypothetical protein CH299_27975 [Rhodococcus sp. 14-2686-1-2]|nr:MULTISPECIES: FAD-dependent oxidoreductase [unclassified Rhodococcus (in: high G+C Gram-positive bacteria)]OZE93189.1 hypothetical protein CH301_27455 [Rhodococcus sp. 15-1189-1-1a]OZF08307.1 hypothetical protein CH299_27975 [Rhodococcus sp. 14-2686-1-2]